MLPNTGSGKFQRRVLATFALSTFVPVMMLGYVAYLQITGILTEQAGEVLRSDAKDYGLMLTERLAWFSGRDLQDIDERRPVLRVNDARDAVVIDEEAFPIDDWLWDLGNFARGHCVDIDSAVRRCGRTPDDRSLVRTWDLFLEGKFETDVTVRVSTHMPRDEVTSRVASLARFPILMAITTALIVSVLAMRLLRSRLKPLHALTEATRQISVGNYEARLDVRTDDEFQEVGVGFNRMAHGLSRSFDTLRQLAEIDRLILISADIEEIVTRVLQAIRGAGVAHPAVVLWDDDESASATLYSMQDPGSDRLRKTTHEGGLRVPASAARMLGSNPDSVRSLAVVVEEVPLGFVLVPTIDSPEAADRAAFRELTDRLAVAITNRNRSERLFIQANFDTLTGLFNRPAFENRLTHALNQSRRTREACAFLFIDLDRFKHVNDTEGHKAGDRVLRLMADRLTRCVREVDTVARFGGDEFGVLVQGYEDDQSLLAICNRLIESLRQPVTVDRIEHVLSVSVGVALFPGDAEDAESLFMRADTAMYCAKADGGDRACFYDADMNKATHARVRLESRLRRAIESSGLQLHYQPKVRCDDGALDSAEGLMRWYDTEDGQINPVSFVPIAEDTGLIHEFLGVCVEQASNAITAVGGSVKIAINASPRQLAREGFADRFLELCRKFDVAPTCLDLEFTESVLIDNQAEVVKELAHLRSLGVRVALDDFGTGYSSLNMLRDLPIDTLKIDQTFIREIETSTEALGLAREVVRIAAVLGKEVVAEGVETPGQRDLLIQSGCHYLQGYLISKPLPLEEFVTFHRSWRAENFLAPLITAGDPRTGSLRRVT